MVIQRRDDTSSKITRCNVSFKSNEEVGSGTFGKVYKVQTSTEVFAVKTFVHSKAMLHLTTLREIKALRSIKSRYVLKINKILVNSYVVHLVLPFYEYDLYKLISSENFSLNEIKHIFWQILKGVEAIHNAGYLHRDLKTANILINNTLKSNQMKGDEKERQPRQGNRKPRMEDKRGHYERYPSSHAYDDFPDRFKRNKLEDINQLENLVEETVITDRPGEEYPGIPSEYEACICDFGMARIPSKEMTESVVTLWYRSPENLLGARVYTRAIDVWSLGCILLEFFNKKPVFNANTDIGVLQMVVDMCGSINSETFPDCGILPLFAMFKLQDGKRCIVEKYGKYNQDMADLADKMLILDPRKRISIRECFDHPFFKF